MKLALKGHLTIFFPMLRSFYVLAATLIFSFLVDPFTYSQAAETTCQRHRVALGPEFYHVKRVRKGGVVQDGYLYGARFNYDHIGRYLIYWGIEAAYAAGTLSGKTGSDRRLKSHFTDQYVEGRIGYTFQNSTGTCASWTPYTGYGYFVENNNYFHPSPAHFHFRNTFSYALLGALTRVNIKPCLTLGLDISAQFNIDGKIKVTHDPELPHSILHYENKIYCRVELPLCYTNQCCGWNGEFCLIPFYEYRQYGEHYQVPFDFPDTKIKIFGAAFQCRLYF